MCDFLILNKDNWMDLLSPSELLDLQTRYPKTWTSKYNARNQKYDIVRVAEDGKLDPYIGGPDFAVIKVPGMSVGEGKAFCGRVNAFAGLDPDGNPLFTVQYKCKCRLKTATIPVNIRNALSTKGVYTVTNFTAFRPIIGTKGVDV